MAALKNHPGMWLRDDAAAAINALEDKYGVLVINSAGRYEWEQQELIDRYDAGDRTIYMPYRPASGSPHVRDGGVAVDIYNFRDDRAKMEEFGFQWTYGMDDPVHYDFIGWSGVGALEANQRRAGADGVRARRAPSTSAEVVDASFLAPNEVGTFAGYVTGDTVAGENRWAKGAFSGLFFWLGGLAPQNVDGLQMLDAPKPALAANQRQADSDGVKGRAAASTAAAQTTFLAPNDVGDFNGWAHGQAIEGEGRWLRGAYSGAWFWLGGLSPRTVDGLAEVKPGTTTPPARPAAPVAVPRTPAYPGAKTGWTVPLGYRWEEPRWVPETRKPSTVINRLIVHHETATTSQIDYFKIWNERESCPTWEVERDGSVNEMIDPKLKPASTGSANEYSVAIETTNTSGAPSWGISDASHEAIAQIAAWLSKQSSIGGVPVDIKLDRQHVIGHNEAGVNATACPGPSMDLDRIVKRAQEISAPPVGPKPDPEPKPPILTPDAATFWQRLFEWLRDFFKGAK